MKVNLNLITPKFKGRREDRNTVSQLIHNNDYALTENNQIKINKAIDNLSKESGDNNIKFLLNVADNLKYATNIDTGKEPKNDWKAKLHSATQKSMASSNPITQDKYRAEVDKVFTEKKSLSEDEVEILNSRKQILSSLNETQLEDIKNPNIKNAKSNLDYFISSSETPIKQKKYITNKLAYLLSPEYKINPQLEDKKTLVFAEMINDLVVNTKESVSPNTKAINQKSHGMCAAISIARKLLSYEDKPNYVDNILEELNDSPTMMVYDKNKIGQKIKVPVEKTYIDYDDAIDKGYRIVDASTLNWMHIAGMYGSESTPKMDFTAFDVNNFGVNNDSYNTKLMDDPDLGTKQAYLQALIKSEEYVGAVKKSNIQKSLIVEDQNQNKNKNKKYLHKLNLEIEKEVREIAPSVSSKRAREISNSIKHLNKKTTGEINEVKDKTIEFNYLKNEEEVIKDKKVANFLRMALGDKVNEDKLNNSVTNLRELAEESTSIEKSMKPQVTNEIARARQLFNAAAAYRHHNIVALNNKGLLTDKQIKLNVIDSDTLLSQNIGKVIKHIQKTGDNAYLESFAPKLGVEPNKNDVVEILTAVKSNVDTTLTQGLDSAYKAIGFVDRKQALLFEVSAMKESIKNGDKESLATAAFSLGHEKADKKSVLKEYDKFQDKLTNGASDKEYIEIYNKMGNKDQLQSFADSFGYVNNAIVNGDEVVTAMFNNTHNLPQDTSPEVSLSLLSQIGSQFNQMSMNTSAIRNAMEVVDINGNVLNSAYPADAVVTKMEDNGEIVSQKELIPLQDRFNKIDKIKSQDEFASRQGNIKDKSLVTLSTTEKATLKKVEKLINKMFSELKREMIYVQRDIKKPYEEHIRKIGVDKGQFWVPKDGSSGLYKEQQVKIIQQMTDRRYHTTEDKEKAFETIKETERSGISSSSVFHNRHGGHAMYIAEISPAGKEGEDVLYHDNSWGASENENTWVDSQGLTRTDYSDIRGGELGYITNDRLLNGNFTHNLLHKAGKIEARHTNSKQLRKFIGDCSESKFPIYGETILAGEDGATQRLAKSLKSTLLRSPMEDLSSLGDIVKEMSQSEIREQISKNAQAGKGYHAKLDVLESRLEKSTFNKGITTEQEYINLKNDDIVKVNFEKVALTRSYPNAVDWKELATKNTVDDVLEMKSSRDRYAREMFDYSFAKEDKILYAYAMNKNNNKTVEILDKALNNNGIKLSDKEMGDIISNTAMFEDDDDQKFDGSLKNTIGFMVNKTLKQFDKVVPQSEAGEQAKIEIKENLTKSLSDALYFNANDIDAKTHRSRCLNKYIDRKYNPETNEDFAEKYRELQDMTTEEFQKETSDVMNVDLGIKDYSGYEMLQRYNGADSKTEMTLKNIMFQKELLADVDLPELTPAYKYHKTYKNEQGAYYKNADPETGKGGRTFDDLYRSYSGTMKDFSLENDINKLRDESYRKYGVMPAFPKVQLINEELFEQSIESINTQLSQTIEGINAKKNTINLCKMLGKLENTTASLKDDVKPTKKQQKMIKELSSNIMSMTYNAPDFKKSNESSVNILRLDSNASGKDYKDAAAGITDQLKNDIPKDVIETLNNGIKSDLKGVKDSVNNILLTSIQENSRAKVKEDFNKWIKQEIKTETADNIMDRIDLLDKKINKYSIPKKSYNHTKNEYINSLEEDLYNISANKTLNLSNDKLLKNIEARTEKFVKGNVKQEYHQAIITHVKELALNTATDGKTKYNQDKSIELQYNLAKDIKKYHILNNPSEMFEKYLLLNAKDSNIHSNDKLVAHSAKVELDAVSEALTGVLLNSTVLDVQNILIDAVDTGSPGAILEKFKKMDSGLVNSKTKVPLSMTDDLVIDSMVETLSVSGDSEGAAMFIDKLGLAEQYVKFKNDNFDLKVEKKNVDKAIMAKGINNLQKNILQEEFQHFNTPEFMTGDSYEEQIDNIKLNIVKKTEKMPMKKNVQIYLTYLDESKKLIAANPELPRNLLMQQVLNGAVSTVDAKVNEKIEKINYGFSNIEKVHNLINVLEITERSSAYPEKESYNNKYDEFIKYNNEKMAVASKV